MGKGSSIVISREVPDCDKHSQLTLDLPISRSSFQLLFFGPPLTFPGTGTGTSHASTSLGDVSRMRRHSLVIDEFFHTGDYVMGDMIVDEPQKLILS